MKTLPRLEQSDEADAELWLKESGLLKLVKINRRRNDTQTFSSKPALHESFSRKLRHHSNHICGFVLLKNSLPLQGVNRRPHLKLQALALLLPAEVFDVRRHHIQERPATLGPGRPQALSTLPRHALKNICASQALRYMTIKMPVRKISLPVPQSPHERHSTDQLTRLRVRHHVG